jgi:hypothetical protein
MSVTSRTRSAAGPPIIIGSLVALLSFAWAFSINNVPLAVILSQLMWDIAFQGYDAVYSSFFPELFQDARPGHGMTPESRDDGAALFPTLFASVAPPGSTKNPAHGRGLPSAPQFLMRSRL